MNETNIFTPLEPNNVEAEHHLISLIAVDGEQSLSESIARGVSPLSFSDFRCGMLYDVATDLFRLGQPVNAETLILATQTKGLLDRIGGFGPIAEITGKVPLQANAAHLAGVVRQFELVRTARAEARRIEEACKAYAGQSLSECIGPSITRLISLGSEQDAPEPNWDQVVDKADAHLETLITAGGLPESEIVPFPWPRANEVFGPFQRGTLNILAARPSVGKSSLARPLALWAAGNARKKVYYVTLETSAEIVPLQMAAAFSRVGLRQIPKAHQKDQEHLRQSLQKLKGLGITISRKDRSMDRILSRARALHASGGLDFIVIDHGLLVSDIANADARQKISAIGTFTKALKALAMDKRLTVLLLWQLNRGSQHDGNRTPYLADLKDSGSLEEDADKVLFIHRPSEDENGKPQDPNSLSSECPVFLQHVIQAKGRDDGTGQLSFRFRRETASFELIR